jgi:hypothetical protein
MSGSKGIGFGEKRMGLGAFSTSSGGQAEGVSLRISLVRTVAALEE